MKKEFINLLSLIFLLTAIPGMAQIELPAPSPAGSTYSKVGLTDVEISYFRPKMRGRMIFGSGEDYLLQYGQVWRTGANSGTIATFSDDVTIDGKTLPAGEYLIYTIPGADKWTVGFYTDTSVGGGIQSTQEEDKIALQTQVVPQKLTETVKTLTINISDIEPDNTGAAIEIAWENTSVKVPFKVSYDEKIMSAIEENTQVNPQNYLTAANYYFTTDRDPNQALEWIKKYFASNENYENQFWNLHLMAQIQAAAGDVKGAKATAEKSLEKARNNEGGDFGYIQRNEDLLAELEKK